jgi:acyl-ACP thioesterase
VDPTKQDFPRISRLQKIEAPTGTLPHTIHYSDLDYNNHCNSCKYLQFMLNADDRLTTIYPIRLDINYVKEVHKDERIHVDVLEKTDEQGNLQSIQYCLLADDGEISCTALLQHV